jgi:hypothetical protein
VAVRSIEHVVGRPTIVETERPHAGDPAFVNSPISW